MRETELSSLFPARSIEFIKSFLDRQDFSLNAEQHASELVDHGSAEKAQAPRMNSGQDEKSAQPLQEKGRRNGVLRIFAAILVIAAIGGLLYWLHARHYEDKDDAQIDGNLSPIGARIDGTVVKVYVQNNQMVKVGDPLVDLDPRDNQVKADQVQAQLAQARSQLAGERPSIPITEVENSTNILSTEIEMAILLRIRC
jgi:membrane fusion protein (multidrug efflux system)